MDRAVVHFHTFGCKVNTYDSGLLQHKALEDADFYQVWRHERCPSIHVINSCAVTQEATADAIRLARKLKSADPFSLVVLTGCAAQVEGRQLLKYPFVDLIVGNSHKQDLFTIVTNYLKSQREGERLHHSSIFKSWSLGEGGGEESHHTRAFLKIQDGCNSFCSFCIIPYARGKSRSIPMVTLVQRIRELESRGFQEVVLTGVHIGDYRDGDYVLEDLIHFILENTKIPRLRLTSLEPNEVSDRLMDYFQNDRLCPHFHLSIQSASDLVLKNMKRKYGAQAIQDCLLKIQDRVPHAFVGMDIIVGFPSETDEDFSVTYQTLEQTPWTRLHVFPYSERKGTRASLMPQLPISLRKERAKILLNLSQERFNREAQKQLGKTKRALILNQGGKGLTRDYWTVKLCGDKEVPVNQEIEVKPVALEKKPHGQQIELIVQ